MPTFLKSYRIYSYDGAHHIVTADIIEAASDEQAIAKAEAACFGLGGFGSKCEIWDGRRMVAQLNDQRLTG